MADDLPPGYKLDPVVVTEGGDDLPPGYTIDGPPSGGAFAAKELAPGQAQQGERRRKLMQLIEAKGEPGYGARLSDNFTLGLMRPLSGAASAVGNAIKGGPLTAGESYRAGVGAEEDYIKRAEANTNPILGGITDVVGGIASGGPGPALVRGAATVAQQAPSKAAKVAQWLMGSTGSGAIEGAARNAEDAGSAGIGAGVGGVLGKASTLIGEPIKKAGSYVVDALQSRMSSGAAKTAVSEAERMGGSAAVKEAGGKIYDRLDKAGIRFNDRQTQPFIGNVVQRLTDVGFNPNMQKQLIPVIGEIGASGRSGATWTQLQNMRTQIGKLKASNDDNLRRVAGELGDELDNFIRTTKPTMPARSVQAGVNPAKEVEEARDLWHRGQLAEKAEYLAEKGSLVTNDTAKKVQQNFSGEVDKVKDPDRFSRFQNRPELVEQMEKIAAGDPAKTSAAKEVNRWSNNLLGYGTIGSAGGLAAIGSGINDPMGVGEKASGAGLLAMAAGLAGKKGSGAIRDMVAEKGTERVNTLIRNIVTGSADKPKIMNMPREALARVLAEEQLKRGTARYSSNWYDKE